MAIGYNIVTDATDKIHDYEMREVEQSHNQANIGLSSRLNAKYNLELNRPENQIARMKQAGINPLMYGSVGSLGSVSSTGGTSGIGSAPRATKLDPLTSAQVRNLEADSNLKEADAKKKASETKGQDIQNDISQVYLSNLPESERLRLDNMKQDLINKGSQNQLTLAQIDETGASAYKLVKDAGKSEADAQLAREQTKYVGFYAKMKAQEVSIEALNTQLKGYGLQLDAQGLKIDSARLLSEDNLRKAQVALSSAKEYFYNQRGKAVDHEIIQGYLQCINGALSAVSKLGSK